MERTQAAATVAALGALLAGVPMVVWPAAVAGLLALGAAFAWDAVASSRAWIRTSAAMTRRLPAAFAIGVRHAAHLRLDAAQPGAWSCPVHDGADSSLDADGLPARVPLTQGSAVELTYHVTPLRRGEVSFEPADLRVRSRWGLCDLRTRVGARDVRRVDLDFAQVARYAWLAGDHRLQEIGVKSSHRARDGHRLRANWPNTGPATRSGTSTGAPPCAWAGRSSAPSRTNATSA